MSRSTEHEIRCGLLGREEHNGHVEHENMFSSALNTTGHKQSTNK